MSASTYRVAPRPTTPTRLSRTHTPIVTDIDTDSIVTTTGSTFTSSGESNNFFDLGLDVELEPRVELVMLHAGGRDHLGIQRGVVDTDGLHPDLLQLPVPARLRALLADAFAEEDA